jgi:hypothetical protein
MKSNLVQATQDSRSPSGAVTLQRGQDRFLLVYRWRRPINFATILFGSSGAAIGLLYLVDHVFNPEKQASGFDFEMVLLLLVSLHFVRMGLAGVRNTTTIEIGDGKLEVCHQPMAIQPPVSLALDSLKGIKPLNVLAFPNSPMHSLQAELKNGEIVNLLIGRLTAGDVEFIANAVAARLAAERPQG